MDRLWKTSSDFDNFFSIRQACNMQDYHFHKQKTLNSEFNKQRNLPNIEFASLNYIHTAGYFNLDHRQSNESTL